MGYVRDLAIFYPGKKSQRSRPTFREVDKNVYEPITDWIERRLKLGPDEYWRWPASDSDIDKDWHNDLFILLPEYEEDQQPWNAQKRAIDWEAMRRRKRQRLVETRVFEHSKRLREVKYDTYALHSSIQRSEMYYLAEKGLETRSAFLDAYSVWWPNGSTVVTLDGKSHDGWDRTFSRNKLSRAAAMRESSAWDRGMYAKFIEPLKPETWIALGTWCDS